MVGVGQPIKVVSLGNLGEAFFEVWRRKGASGGVCPLFLEPVPVPDLVTIRQCGRTQGRSHLSVDGLPQRRAHSHRSADGVEMGDDVRRLIAQYGAEQRPVSLQDSVGFVVEERHKRGPPPEC